jgi:hypothetical protein
LVLSEYATAEYKVIQNAVKSANRIAVYSTDNLARIERFILFIG